MHYVDLFNYASCRFVLQFCLIVGAGWGVGDNRLGGNCAHAYAYSRPATRALEFSLKFLL